MSRRNRGPAATESRSSQAYRAGKAVRYGYRVHGPTYEVTTSQADPADPLWASHDPNRRGGAPAPKELLHRNTPISNGKCSYCVATPRGCS